MIPEAQIVDRIVARLDKLLASAAADLEWLGVPPATLAEFEAMAPHRQSASRAALKSFEQIEDQLSRAFRAIPKLLGEDSSRWFARDHADYMERFGLLDDAADWTRVVKLRNELVHDYPIDPQTQFKRLVQAIECLPYLEATAQRLSAFARDVLPGKML